MKFPKLKKKSPKEAAEGAEQDEKEAAAEEKKPEGEGEEAGEGAQAEGDAGKGKKKLIIIVAAIVLVLLISAAAAVLFIDFSPAKKEPDADLDAAKQEEAAKPVYFDLPQLLVNLNTSGKNTSFIKTTITLELSNLMDVPAVQANLPRLIDSYNTLLREMKASDLYGSAGVYRLREEMLVRANTVLEPVKVKDVLFREILVQ